MLKKLTEEKLDEIIEAGISEFAEHGLTNTGMNQIAQRSGISVGVLYKYFEDKDDLFKTCLAKSLSVLEEYVQGITGRHMKTIDYARELIRSVQTFSRDNKDYIRMYHAVTTGNDPVAAGIYAEKIESLTAGIYTEMIREAKLAGDVRADLDPAMFAMFFDDLLMMMQFTYSCPYYMERFRIYTGHKVGEDDDFVAEQLLKFLESAFTFSSDQIVHS